MEHVESPIELLELAISYQRSQVLFTFAELEIANILEKKKLSAKDLAEKLEINPLAMERFLNSCVAIGLLEKEKDSYKNSHLSKQFLVKGKDFYLGGQMRRYQKRSYPNWGNLTEHLQNWDYGESADETPEDEDQDAEAMAEQHKLALMHGFALAESFDFSKYKNLLDVGGGTGAMSIALCENYENLSATVFDLSENVEKASEFITKCSAKNRIETIGGDVTKDDLPKDFDLALLANLLAVFDAETNIKFFKKIYDKLPVGGAILISGWILDENRLSPEISVLFCLEDICWNSPDVERNFGVYKNWLEKAGFRDISIQTYFEPTRLICAYK
jgi:predicted O-methyltransferase YrrM